MVDFFYALGLQQNMVLTTKRSRSAKGSKRGTVDLTCENYGDFSKIPNKEGKTKRSTRTKISGCPFELRGAESIHGSWSMRVVNGMHNHHLPERLLGHAYAARLSPHGKKHVESQSAAGTPPKAVLLGLENQDPESVSTRRNIYNHKQMLRRKNRAGLTIPQYALKLLNEKNYYYPSRRSLAGDDTLRDLFMSHPDSRLLLQHFPYVLIMDCTYKTNVYVFYPYL
jgi:hypothetical protein